MTLYFVIVPYAIVYNNYVSRNLKKKQKHKRAATFCEYILILFLKNIGLKKKKNFSFVTINCMNSIKSSA